jgi:hypothetical protein
MGDLKEEFSTAAASEMADVRASVARMWDACPGRRTFYFYAVSIKQSACHGIGRKRDRRLRHWTEAPAHEGLLRTCQQIQRPRQHLPDLWVADLSQRHIGREPLDGSDALILLRASREPVREH